jgi:hypothetical protein
VGRPTTRPRATCWAGAGLLPPCRSSGASTTTCSINYVGHAEKWDQVTIDGDIGAKDCLLRYKTDGRVLAVASIYRDAENLASELAMERQAAA